MKVWEIIHERQFPYITLSSLIGDLKKKKKESTEVKTIASECSPTLNIHNLFSIVASSSQ